jgi:hypothetical protein
VVPLPKSGLLASINVLLFLAIEELPPPVCATVVFAATTTVNVSPGVTGSALIYLSEPPEPPCPPLLALNTPVLPAPITTALTVVTPAGTVHENVPGVVNADCPTGGGEILTIFHGPEILKFCNVNAIFIFLYF